MSDISRGSDSENIISFVSFLAIVLMVMWVRSVSPAMLVKYQLDKAAHFFVSFFLATLFYSVMAQYRWGTLRTAVFAGGWALILGWIREAGEYFGFVANMERFTPQYGAEVTYDLLANACGVALFFLSVRVLRKYFFRRMASE